MYVTRFLSIVTHNELSKLVFSSSIYLMAGRTPKRGFDPGRQRSLGSFFSASPVVTEEEKRAKRAKAEEENKKNQNVKEQINQRLDQLGLSAGTAKHGGKVGGAGRATFASRWRDSVARLVQAVVQGREKEPVVWHTSIPAGFDSGDQGSRLTDKVIWQYHRDLTPLVKLPSAVCHRFCRHLNCKGLEATKGPTSTHFPALPKKAPVAKKSRVESHYGDIRKRLFVETHTGLVGFKRNYGQDHSIQQTINHINSQMPVRFDSHQSILKFTGHNVIVDVVLRLSLQSSLVGVPSRAALAGGVMRAAQRRQVVKPLAPSINYFWNQALCVCSAWPTN